MNPFRRRLLAATAVAPLWSSALAQKKAFSSTPRALGYVPWWMAEAWRDMPLAQLDRLVLFEAAVQPDGAMDDNDWGGRARELAAFASERSIPLDIALTLHGQSAFDRVFLDARARRRLTGECERWLGQSYIAGLHLDIEGYAPADRRALGAFREWLRGVDGARKAARKGLSAFFPADDHFTPYDAASAARVDFWVAQV